MRTKTYVLTENEIMVIRDALIELYQERKALKMNSPIAIEQFKTLIALKDQFKDNARIIGG